MQRPPDSAALIDRMAADLRQHAATATESDAIRCLMKRGYRDGDIVALMDEALFRAQQNIVKTEMERRS